MGDNEIHKQAPNEETTMMSWESYNCCLGSVSIYHTTEPELWTGEQMALNTPAQ